MQLVIPAYVAPLTVVTMVALVAAVARVVTRAAADAGLASATRTRVAAIATLALGSWLFTAWLRAPATAQVDASGRGIIPVAFAVFGVGSFVVVFGALALSDAWRRTVSAIPVERLVAVQTFRAIGFVFVQLWAIGSLPGQFALPAGWGDVAIGLTAPFVALALARRASGSRGVALTWNTLGILDLVTAVGMGTGLFVRLVVPGTPLEPAAAMTIFPLVLVPTFGVPLALILHLLTFRALAAERRKERGGPVSLSPHPAAAR